MPTSFIVVDDFLDDPYPMRNAALQLNYPEVQGPYPGRNSTQQINIEGLHQEVSRLVGEPLLPMDHNQAHGQCRIALASDVGTAKVHVDASHWSGILYLSLPEDCRVARSFSATSQPTPSVPRSVTRSVTKNLVYPLPNNGRQMCWIMTPTTTPNGR